MFVLKWFLKSFTKYSKKHKIYRLDFPSQMRIRFFSFTETAAAKSDKRRFILHFFIINFYDFYLLLPKSFSCLKAHLSVLWSMKYSSAHFPSGRQIIKATTSFKCKTCAWSTQYSKEWIFSKKKNKSITILIRVKFFIHVFDEKICPYKRRVFFKKIVCKYCVRKYFIYANLSYDMQFVAFL